jgi:cellobiose phosphorylase
MGSGDWNDGMNLVGIEGKGESVWLAFFLCKVLFSVAKVAAMRKDKDFSQLCLSEAGKLSRNIEKYAWDGQWYLRAYYDNGETMGSSLNSECLIDSIPQSWAVISGAASRERAIKAMLQVDQLLVDRKNNLIKLFEPPFDACACDPGYIKGYVPGVRENGGQYTHAAVWAAMAFAILKDRKRAWELLSIINPVLHSGSPDKRDIYKVEPYVMAADVYALKSNAGRGGWTWYTGSASWMYQLIVRHLLGIRLSVDHLYFEPCLPEGWKSFKLHYRYRETFYHITIQRSGPNDHVLALIVDGKEQAEKTIALTDDRLEHTAQVTIG